MLERERLSIPRKKRDDAKRRTDSLIHVDSKGRERERKIYLHAPALALSRHSLPPRNRRLSKKRRRCTYTRRIEKNVLEKKKVILPMSPTIDSPQEETKTLARKKKEKGFHCMQSQCIPCARHPEGSDRPSATAEVQRRDTKNFHIRR